ncbi:MAG: phosphonatase-like hydrolase [Microscillaceae bacterium]
MAIKLVVMDMAGTTVEDPQLVHEALIKAFEAHQIDISFDQANRVMGYPKPVAIEMLLEEQKVASNPAFIEQMYAHFLRNMLAEYRHRKELCEKLGATALFRALRQSGIRVVLDTGFSREVVDTLIDRLGWQNEIDGSVASDEVKQGRPFPDMIWKAMQMMQVAEVSQVAKVGDTPSDIQQGRAAGCEYVIGITTGAFTAEALEKETPTHLVHNLSELGPLLLNGTKA